MKAIKNISIFDTSIATQNVGDEIIMDAIYNELNEVFDDAMFLKIPSHEIIGISSLSLIRNSDFGIVGGSNILASSMNKYRQWKISILQSFLIKNKTILLGVGWRNYQQKPNFYTKKLLKNLLSKKYIHSVRDSYTEKKLQNEGFANVLNTACPTMWKLTPEHCAQIPEQKSKKVIFTLTDYSKDLVADTFFVNTLLSNYNEIFYWVQSRKDLIYLNELGFNTGKIKIIPPRLKSYTDFLENNDCDYIGTRLHGGIRALQKKRRAIIIGVDNRAIEKKKDFNLNVIFRSEQESKLVEMINSNFETQIKIPLDNISKWKNQFKN